MENKIPKIIHYVWVGPNTQSDIIKKCLESWSEKLKGYEIKLWNENNFEIEKYPFTRLAYRNKKYAYVADYIRLFVLEKFGGIYLDTDMYVLKDFYDFLNYDLILAKEDEIHISAGMIAATKNNLYIQKLLDYYNQNTEILEPIPKIMTKIFEEYQKEIQNPALTLAPKYFYPYNSDNIKIFLQNNFQGAPIESYAVHLWDYSWGHPLNKFIKKIGLHKFLKEITEKLKIKNIIKRILKME